MAPNPLQLVTRELSKRQNRNCYRDSFGRVRCYNSAWGGWGRWVLLGAVIFVFALSFFLFACLSARRRRRRGIAPFRGTGWAAGRTPPGHGPAQYTGASDTTTSNPSYYQTSQAQPYYQNNQGWSNNNDQQQPPSYQPQNQGYGGYYGGQQQGVELASPQQAYQRDNVYAPPSGPPPVGK